ncbi:MULTISPECIES: V-type ATP synthase subunit C [Methanothermobacter]|uniref:A-type ATP synthase subunit C n=1 Tax=Methanothermobacter wolfeii TaxID=145261 RepID=A0A9E7RT66_METWO|nr:MULTISPECIES: V-type ATP synthase subunit C [Methanothermobacter]QHN06707.1 V-type ATP synthase subunit C [Methanothermobacter sp. THM-1]UXH31245.1 V-type ATP synthase subunit C [Methanothermobacter wolfeii]
MADSITTIVTALGFPSVESFIGLLLVGGAIIGAIVVIATIRPILDLFPFAYPNARVRARIGRLINEKQFSEILETENLEEFMNYLRGLPDYAKYVDRFPVEKALESQLAETYETVSKIAPASIREPFRVNLKKWDIRNIKSLITAKDAGLGAEETLNLLVPFGEIYETLEALTDSETVQDVVAGLEGTEYAQVLEDALSEYGETGMILPLEAALDRYYLENMMRAVGSPSDDNTKLLHTYFGTQVDISNIKIILRAKADGLSYDDISPYMIQEGYQLREWKLKDLMEAEDVSGVISGLEGTDYGPMLSEALSEYSATGSISVFERVLEENLNRMARNFALKKPFGVGPMIGFLSRKEVEVRNLKVIARSKREPGFPESMVKEMLA